MDGSTGTSEPQRLRALLVSAAVGAAAAAAAVAIIVPVVAWSMRATNEWTLDSPPGAAVVAVVIGVSVLASLTYRLLLRRTSWGRPFGFAATAGVALAGWSLWVVVAAYRDRASLPFVDSTGATLLTLAASLAAALAVVLILATAAFIGRVDRRTTSCAFVVVAVTVAGSIYWSVQAYRADVWYPELTAASAVPAPRPDVIGKERYRLSLAADASADVYPIGNGFIENAIDGVVAYDGPTGAARWRATDLGPTSRHPIQAVEFVRRDRDDTAGIVVLVVPGAIVALDGSSGDVLWRRQFSGDMTAVAGSVDALGMTIFDAAAKGDRTRLHSFDPATGAVRWSAPISCSSPTAAPGTAGQFIFRCGPGPSVYDAHTGAIVDMSGLNSLNAQVGADDVYVSSTFNGGANADVDVKAEDETLVFDPTGRILDRVPGSYPVSSSRHGYLLLRGTGGAWLLRDHRNHRSTPVPLPVSTRDASGVRTAWLQNSLVVYTAFVDAPLFVVDPAAPARAPARIENPCPTDSVDRVRVVAGAVIAVCSSNKIVGLTP